jgi:hypothetical protein
MLVGIPKLKWRLGKRKRSWKDIRQNDITETGYEGLDWTHVGQCRDLLLGIQWQARTNTMTVSKTRRNLSHGAVFVYWTLTSTLTDRKTSACEIYMDLAYAWWWPLPQAETCRTLYNKTLQMCSCDRLPIFSLFNLHITRGRHTEIIEYHRLILFPMEQEPLAYQGLLIIEASLSHFLDTLHSVGLLWTSDQPVTETSAWQHTTPTRDRYPCP